MMQKPMLKKLELEPQQQHQFCPVPTRILWHEFEVTADRTDKA